MAAPSVRVSLSDAVERRLPLVSVRSGQPADGYLGVPVGLGLLERTVWSVTQRRTGGPTVQLPLTQNEFDHVMRLRRAERSGVVNGFMFFVLGVALARFPLLLSLGLVIGVLSVALAFVARVSLSRVSPQVSAHRGVVTIGRVHEDFARSVESGGRRYN